MTRNEIAECFFGEYSPEHIAMVLGTVRENLYRWDAGSRPKLPTRFAEIRDLAHHVAALEEHLRRLIGEKMENSSGFPLHPGDTRV